MRPWVFLAVLVLAGCNTGVKGTGTLTGFPIDSLSDTDTDVDTDTDTDTDTDSGTMTGMPTGSSGSG